MENKDELTGLYNRWGFYFKVEERLKQAGERKYQLLCANIKSFKLINDLFGFAAGNRMLKNMGAAIAKQACEECVYARINADYFGILVPEDKVPDMLKMLTESDFYAKEDKDYLLHINVGIYEIDDTTIPVSLMYDRAHLALNAIRNDRSKHVAYFKENMREQMLKEQYLYNELHRAIKNREMIMYLQGLYDAEQNVVGAEALVRWNHPEKGILPAGMFVETLEQNGLISTLDKYIWELACEQLKKWEQEDKGQLFLSVNISAKDFEDMDVCEVLTGLVRKHGVPPEKLRLEITETTLMKDIETNLKVVNALRTNGFMVEIDDFGSGYSSLNMLKEIMADVVKLDMKFLQKCSDEQRSRTILQTMVELIKKLGMQTVVEGVETKEQFELLKEYRCDVFQGYYLMRPQPIDCFEKSV